MSLSRRFIYFAGALLVAAAFGCDDGSNVGSGGTAPTTAPPGSTTPPRPGPTPPPVNNSTPDVDTGEHEPEDAGVDAGGEPDTFFDPDASTIDLDTDLDADPALDSGPDAEPVEPATECEEQIRLNQNWTVDGAGATNQAGARMVFDGAGIWTAYSRPVTSGSSERRIYAARMGCQGTRLVSPVDMSRGKADHVSAPAIAHSGDRIYVVWDQGGDDGDGELYMRIYRVLGSIVTSEPVQVTPHINNTSFASYAIEPSVAGLPGGGAVIAASVSVGDRFRVVIQKIDDRGRRSGNALYVNDSTTVGDQSGPSVSVGSDGRIYVTYTQHSSSSGSQRVVFTSFGPTATRPSPLTPANAHPSISPTALGVFSKAAALESPAPWLLFEVSGSRNEFIIRDGAAGSTSAYQSFGVGSRINLAPSIDAGLSGGVVAWLTRTASGSFHQVQLQRFWTEEGALGRSSLVDVQSTAVGGGLFGTDVVHLYGNVYAVIWSEGTSEGQARLRLRYVTVP
ncbi:MAG: hypothetical protein ACNA8W_14590 [Bradymonadaceae bacterium]